MLQDVRYGLRMMARNPGVTAVAALALALGIGANTAIFSVVNAVLLRPLPFRDPGRLVWIWQSNTARNIPFAFMNYATYADWRRESRSFELTSAYQPGWANLTTRGEPERLNTVRVNSTFLAMLGVRSLIGRDFLAEEDRPGAGRVAILDYKLFQRRFGGDRNLVGGQIQLDAQSYTVIGVLPPEFEFGSRETDVYLPIARSTARGGDPVPVGAYGRLKPGASIERAEAEIDAVYRGLERQFPNTKGWTARLWRVRDFLVRDVRLSLLVLLAAVALVLLIACANVANLLLARAGERQKEIAMRTALGAGRARILRQLLTESLLLGVVGGALGLLLAWWGVRLLPLVAPERYPFLKQTAIDLRVLCFTGLASLATGLMFGLAPALAASRAQVFETLKEGGRGSGESRGRNRFRSALVVVEVALALLLIVGASLLMRSLVRLQDSKPGFNPNGLLTASISLPPSKYPESAQRVAFFHQLLDRVEALPGVEAASITNLLPLSGMNVGMGVLIEGQPPPRPGEMPIVFARVVDRRYFQAMQVPLQRGRLFTERDAGAPRVAIVNETMARRFWPGQDPIGKRFGNSRDWITVVGVVGDMKHTSITQAPDAEYFEPYPQGPRSEMVLAVRTAADPMRLAPALRNAVLELDPDQPVSRVVAMSRRLSDSIAPQRFSALLLGIFALVALALAAVGIYGVISFSVTRRTHEIGVRLALGARRNDVLGMVVLDAVGLALIGVAIGVAGGLALTRLLGSLLYGVSATDPVIFAAVSLVLTAVAALASFLPARRAARVDPIVALRYGG
ncbi:MAG: ABC transporter permease [Bryobacteraceae bacterium]